MSRTKDDANDENDTSSTFQQDPEQQPLLPREPSESDYPVVSSYGISVGKLIILLLLCMLVVYGTVAQSKNGTSNETISTRSKSQSSAVALAGPAVNTVVGAVVGGEIGALSGAVSGVAIGAEKGSKIGYTVGEEIGNAVGASRLGDEAGTVVGVFAGEVVGSVAGGTFGALEGAEAGGSLAMKGADVVSVGKGVIGDEVKKATSEVVANAPKESLGLLYEPWEGPHPTPSPGTASFGGKQINLACFDPNRATSIPCTREYIPVCGCNNKTYPTECVARSKGVESWTPGVCVVETAPTSVPTSIPTSLPIASPECFDPAKKNNNMCPMYYLPVCGCNGRTYSNTCVAESAGIKKWTDGMCGSGRDSERILIGPTSQPTTV